MNLDVPALIGITSGSVGTVTALFVMLWKNRCNGYRQVQDKMDHCLERLNSLSSLPDRLSSVAQSIDAQLEICEKRYELSERRQGIIEKTLEKHMNQTKAALDAVDRRLKRLEDAGQPEK